VSGKGCEDATVLRFPANQALVQSVDILTPMVNDPYIFGCIAAANSLSDIYAMGAQPFSAMNIMCFPQDCLSMDVLRHVLQGGRETVRAAGALMAGGHTVQDPELKFGLAVTGQVHPDHVAVNGGAQEGDLLVLTKPVGTGILATGIKARWPHAQEFEQLLATWAGRLNAVGAQVIRNHNIRGATDITGFGLGGHALEMAKGSDVHIQIWIHEVPLLDYSRDLAAVGLVPAGAHANKAHCQEFLSVNEENDLILEDIMFDPQTSGGLLLAVAESKLDKVRNELREQGDMAAVIGRVFSASEEARGVGLSFK